MTTYEQDLINRLRCRYPIGPMVNGEPEGGWRDFSGELNGAITYLPMPIMLEAAQCIERLQAKNDELRAQLEARNVE